MKHSALEAVGESLRAADTSGAPGGPEAGSERIAGVVDAEKHQAGSERIAVPKDGRMGVCEALTL